jgi:hypothetical protein
MTVSSRRLAMAKWLKRIRGALGLGLTWAVAWFGVGVVFLSGLLVFGNPPAGTGIAAVLANSLLAGVFGFIGGTGFSVLLAIAERRRTFAEMSLARFAAFGGVAGLLLALLPGGGGGPPTVANAIFGIAVTLMGAGSAAGSLALARRAEERKSLPEGDDPDEAGLPTGDRQSLPG